MAYLGDLDQEDLDQEPEDPKLTELNNKINALARTSAATTQVIEILRIMADVLQKLTEKTGQQERATFPSKNIG